MVKAKIGLRCHLHALTNQVTQESILAKSFQKCLLLESFNGISHDQEPQSTDKLKMKLVHFQPNASLDERVWGYCDPQTNLLYGYGFSTENWQKVNCKRCLNKKKAGKKRTGVILGGMIKK